MRAGAGGNDGRGSGVDEPEEEVGGGDSCAMTKTCTSISLLANHIMVLICEQLTWELTTLPSTPMAFGALRRQFRQIAVTCRIERISSLTLELECRKSKR